MSRGSRRAIAASALGALVVSIGTRALAQATTTSTEPVPVSSAATSAVATLATTPAASDAPGPTSEASTPRYADLPALTWRSINTRQQVCVRVYRDDGSLDAEVLPQLANVLRDVPTGQPSPVVPRTVQLLVRVATHFHADTIEIISGYRSGRSASGRLVRHEGYHSVGSAVDFRIPGVEMRTVAAYARTFAHVGVGYYPTSGFVHLDSREQTFLWENRAGHGRRGWDRPLDRSGCTVRDANWTSEQDRPWDAPGQRVALNTHPRTQQGAHPPHYHHHHGHHHQATRSRTRTTHVFRGTN